MPLPDRMMSRDDSQPINRNIVQGEYASSNDPRCCFTTILGSCVSVCLYDEEARIGGMNHFLLPDGASSAMDEVRFGLHAMELLINDLFKGGASRSGLSAKLFGGASMMAGLSDVGARNVDFAKRFLKDEGFQITASETGGSLGRRLRFWPVSARAQMRYIRQNDVDHTLALPRAQAEPKSEIELF